MANQTIKCRVHTCKFNDVENMCSLNDIQVGNCESAAHSKAQTECESFEEK